MFEDDLLQLSLESFHEVFEIALRFTTVSKRAYFINLTDFEVPKILLAKYSFAAIRSGRVGIVFVSDVRHRARGFSSNYFFIISNEYTHLTGQMKRGICIGLR